MWSGESFSCSTEAQSGTQWCCASPWRSLHHRIREAPSCRCPYSSQTGPHWSHQGGEVLKALSPPVTVRDWLCALPPPSHEPSFWPWNLCSQDVKLYERCKNEPQVVVLPSVSQEKKLKFWWVIKYFIQYFSIYSFFILFPLIIHLSQGHCYYLWLERVKAWLVWFIHVKV